MITDQRLQVITSAPCNQETALQAVITEEIRNRALQEQPVITGNRPVVIVPLGMGSDDGSENPVSVTSIDRDYVSYLTTPITNIEGQWSVGR